MIYYFSGTGNSRYAAEKLARLTGDKCVNIAAIYNGSVTSVTGRNDVTGFVFPVYYGGLPEMVKRFVSHNEIKNNLAPYVYAVITCGGDAFAADSKLEKALGRPLDLSISLKMPDNYVIAYNPSTKDEALTALKAADGKLNGIGDRILRKEKHHNTDLKKKLISGCMYSLYPICRTTLFFKANDNCNSCGMCAKICPDRAIKIKNGKPEWIKNRCQHCTACINNCPQNAIQFTRLTEKRGRYSMIKLIKETEK